MVNVLVGGHESLDEGRRNSDSADAGEFFVERQFSDQVTVSGLLGLIWPISPDLSVDVAFRLGKIYASLGSGLENELRIGFSWAIP